MRHLLEVLKAALLGLALAGCASDPRLASIDETQEYVIGGDTYRVTNPRFFGPGQYNPVVALTTPAGVTVVCSGVLIDRTTVLTAAHCACRRHHIEVRFGTDARRANPIHTVSERRLARGARCTLSSQRGRDLALLTLSDEVRQPAFRDDPGELIASQPIAGPPTHRVIIATGFGANVEGAASSGLKAGTAVPIISTECRDPLDQRMGYDCVAGAELVAISRRVRADSCDGDSGGPAWVETDQGLLVVAIVSRGIYPSARCGDGGVYTLVTPRIVDDIRSQPTLELGLP